jgi:hypothetical protein
VDPLLVILCVVSTINNHSAFQLPEQDLVNVYAHDHPDRIFVLPCEWNVRSDSICRKRTSAAIVHGSRKGFHGNEVGMPNELAMVAAWKVLKAALDGVLSTGSITAAGNKALRKKMREICRRDDIEDGYAPHPDAAVGVMKNITEAEYRHYKHICNRTGGFCPVCAPPLLTELC